MLIISERVHPIYVLIEYYVCVITILKLQILRWNVKNAC